MDQRSFAPPDAVVRVAVDELAHARRLEQVPREPEVRLPGFVDCRNLGGLECDLHRSEVLDQLVPLTNAASGPPRDTAAVLPNGVELHQLEPHADSRGVFTELFRDSWGLPVEPVQWNAVRSEANVLRGVHVHWQHADYLTVVVGRAAIGLHDLREGSETEGAGYIVELDADSPAALAIPPGVAHGFYFHEPSMHVYAVSHEWDPADELGCRWDDPALGISWPCSEPLISGRDRELGPLSALRGAWRAALAAAVH